MSDRGQVRAKGTVSMGAEVFGASVETALWWLTNAGFLINARGTLVMIDPAIMLEQNGDSHRVAEGVCSVGGGTKSNSVTFPVLRHETGHRLLVPLPMTAAGVRRVDVVLYTHGDYDHFAPATARELMRTEALFVGPPPVAAELRELGLPETRIRVARAGETFPVGTVTVVVTPADHPWQVRDPERFGPAWKAEDCCGYLVTTPDGGIFHPGDTRLMAEHLRLEGVEVLLLDVSRNEYHLGVADAARLADALGSLHVIPHHYGSYDAPEATEHNPYDGDPAEVAARIRDAAHRFRVLAPGERFAVGGGEERSVRRRSPWADAG